MTTTFQTELTTIQTDVAALATRFPNDSAQEVSAAIIRRIEIASALLQGEPPPERLYVDVSQAKLDDIDLRLQLKAFVDDLNGIASALAHISNGEDEEAVAIAVEAELEILAAQNLLTTLSEFSAEDLSCETVKFTD